jgi:uncharacterized protein YbjT (DUF2867 family)
MGKILVTGGTGTLGKEVVKKLLDEKQSVAVLSSKNNPEVPQAVEVLKGDLTNKESLPKALSEAEIVIHCASNPHNPGAEDIEGTKNLLSVLDKNHLRHFIYISIVGVDKSNYPYYVAKYETEKVIAGAGFPFSVLRATQFHDLVLYRLIYPADKNNDTVITIPANMRFQSIDVKEVAAKVCDLVEQKPKGEVLSIGGPEILTLEEMAESYLNVFGKKKQISLNVQDASFVSFKSGVNLCPEYNFGKVTWMKYLQTLNKIFN